MYNQIISHLQGASNLDTAIIVAVYALAISLALSGISSLTRSFRAPQIHNHYNDY